MEAIGKRVCPRKLLGVGLNDIPLIGFRVLLESGCRMYLEVGNKDGKRPVHEAAHFSRKDCLQTLIQAGM